MDASAYGRALDVLARRRYILLNTVSSIFFMLCLLFVGDTYDKVFPNPIHDNIGTALRA